MDLKRHGQSTMTYPVAIPALPVQGPQVSTFMGVTCVCCHADRMSDMSTGCYSICRVCNIMSVGLSYSGIFDTCQDKIRLKKEEKKKVFQIATLLPCFIGFCKV